MVLVLFYFYVKGTFPHLDKQDIKLLIDVFKYLAAVLILWLGVESMF